MEHLSVVGGVQKFTNSKRVTTGLVAGSAQAAITVTWDKPFPTTDYTVIASVLLDVAGASLEVVRIRSKTTTGCVIQVLNRALTGQSGSLEVIAISDT